MNERFSVNATGGNLHYFEMEIILQFLKDYACFFQLSILLYYLVVLEQQINLLMRKFICLLFLELAGFFIPDRELF
jgi:hypothetical protein